MDAGDATFWIRCGAGMGAIGLYTLMNAAPGIPVVPNRVLRAFGWSAYCAAGVLIAGTALQSTGSFWSLLLFCVLAAAVLLCATVAVLHQPFETEDGTATRLRAPGVDLRWQIGAITAVAGILLWHGVDLCGALLLTAVAGVGTASWWGPRVRAHSAAGTRDGAPAGFHEPALTAVMWGVMVWGLMAALVDHRIEDGRLNNALVVACGLLPLGAVPIAARTQLRPRMLGLSTLLLATLMCLSGADPSLANPLGLTVMACYVASCIVILPRRSVQPLPRGDT